MDRQRIDPDAEGSDPDPDGDERTGDADTEPGHAPAEQHDHELARADVDVLEHPIPLAILPTPLQALGLLSPIGWWIEGVRQALDPAIPSGLGGPGSVLASWLGRPPGPLEIVIALLLTGAVGTLAAAIVFRGSTRRARDRGLLDVTTGS
jgi:hypothetical protein